MTADQRQRERMRRDFDRDGFVVWSGFLSPRDLAELRSHTDRCLSELERNEGHFQGVLKGLDHVDPWFEEQLVRGEHTELISELLQDELVPATAAWFSRIPGESSGIKPHIDAVGDRREGATLWIALDRADRENGCLYYVKGSHRLSVPSRYGLEGFGPDSPGAVAIEVEPGDAIVHSSLIVHWSEANRSQRPREAITYFYWASSSRADAHSSRHAPSEEDVPEEALEQARE